MSQTNTSLLDEVVQWSQETCRRELKAVLPKLTSLHYEADTWDDHLRILKIITEMFLPHIGLSELEEECFSKILPKAVTMFDNMMKEIMNQVGELSSQNTELCAFLRNILQAMVQVIDALSICVRHVGSFEEGLCFDAIRSLLTCILKVLRETFQHCKDSEVVYCGRLSLVADLLQGLFKEAYSLQKSLLEVLDRISLDTSASDEEVSDIVTVVHSLLDICTIISNLDIALHANTWKFLINCVEMAEQIKLASLQESVQSPEYKLFQKTAKMCRFFANTLVHYIKEFKYFLTKKSSCFHQLYLQIISKFPPSLCAPSLPTALAGELNASALVPMDAFLLQLLPLRPFAEVVLQPDMWLSPEHEFPHFLMLVNIMGQLLSQPEEVMQLWYPGSQLSGDTQRIPLYQAIFISFRRCYTERKLPVLVPGVMLKGQAQVEVTLHQHICVQLCASVAVLPPVYFPVLEHCLVDAVLQADTLTALLAADVWCFTVRYGTAELCLHHVLLIAQLVKACRTECYQLFHLGSLLKRMVFLMTPSHQLELVAEFPPSKVENLPVWHHVLLRALSQDVRLRVETEIVGLMQRVLTEWQDGGYKLGEVDKVNAALGSLLSVLRGQSSPEEPCLLSAVRMTTQLWSRLSPTQLQTHPVLQHTLKLLLSATTVLVKSIKPETISQALLCLEAVVSQKCPDHLLLAALEFLSSLGKMFFPADIQSQILPRLSSLFGVLLADKSWLLHQHALEAFSYFAENTNHEEVISQSLCVEETKTKVVNYLSKTLNSLEDVESRLQRLKREKSVIERHNEKLESKESGSDKQAAEAEAITDSEPSPKRARQETSAEEEYDRHIQMAQSSLKALQALVESKANTTAPPPSWLEGKLQELMTLITEITVRDHTT
ncbi:FIGNL1-interacting regulator of recombination and mitosis isoform 3-T3 [Anableps anableps]